jgi:hypothetical protein
MKWRKTVDLLKRLLFIRAVVPNPIKIAHRILTQADRTALAAFLSMPESRLLLAFLREQMMSREFLGNSGDLSMASTQALIRVSKDEAYREISNFILNFPAVVLEETLQKKDSEYDDATSGNILTKEQL